MRYVQRGLTHHDPACATPGFTLYTPLCNATAYLVNMAGAIVHLSRQPNSSGQTYHLVNDDSLGWLAILAVLAWVLGR